MNLKKFRIWKVGHFKNRVILHTRWKLEEKNIHSKKDGNNSDKLKNSRRQCFFGLWSGNIEWGSHPCIRTSYYWALFRNHSSDERWAMLHRPLTSIARRELGPYQLNWDLKATRNYRPPLQTCLIYHYVEMLTNEQCFFYVRSVLNFLFVVWYVCKTYLLCFPG